MWRSRFSLVTEHFTAEYDSAGTETLYRQGVGTEEFLPVQDPHFTAMEQFLTAVTGREEPLVPISQGYESLDLVLQVARQFRGES